MESLSFLGLGSTTEEPAFQARGPSYGLHEVSVDGQPSEVIRVVFIFLREGGKSIKGPNERPENPKSNGQYQ